MTIDTRWKQRFSNYELALVELTRDLSVSKSKPLSRMEEKGLIKTFEFTFELAWNCMKDICENKDTPIRGSKDAIYQANKRGLIENFPLWMDMVDSRIKTAHTYHKELADSIAAKIIENYYSEFIKLRDTLKQLEK